MGVEFPLPLIHGPFLLLYVFSLIRPKPIFRKMDWLHFVPIVTCYLFLLPDGFFTTAPELLEFAFETVKNAPPLYWQFFEKLISISGVVYVIWSLIALHRHKKTIEDNFSDLEKINLNWLKKLILGMAVIWVIVIFMDNSDYIFLAVSGFVFIIGYFGFKQGQVFTDNAVEITEISEKNGKNKYEKSSLTEEKSLKYLKELNQLIEEEKPYLESKISLKELAERLNIHPNHLSQVINEKLNLNFYDFINGHRIEEFKKRLSEDKSKKFTLLAHAYDSGYSSKSSFNEVFKKFTDMTPSQYQKQLHT